MVQDHLGVIPNVQDTPAALSYEDDSLLDAAVMQAQERYKKEREKRLRSDGTAQYINVINTEKFKHFREDPWVEGEPPSEPASRNDGSHVKFLLLGAGFGGLIFAIRLMEAGVDIKDIRFVDMTAGFGGTWYWNRYPGVMCDIESYCYLPLLEETGYMPKHRYSYGTEIREYTNLIADKWSLRDKAMFQTQVKSMDWDNTAQHWKIDMLEDQKGHNPVPFHVTADYVVSVSGALVWPQLPDVPGIDKFQGEYFHTSRWDYDLTGGSPTDWTLSNLKDKNVAIIGTGATGIQAVPELAKWAKHLYVFQRTPSAVDERGQQPTDPKFWAEISQEKGWQRKRRSNFDSYLSNAAPKSETDLVNDGWTAAPTMAAVLGNPNLNVSMDNQDSYLKSLHRMDLPRQDRIRDRAEKVVHDQKTADGLKAWYPSWCKRPCFHDDYLEAFNRPNVTLVETEGKGLEAFTPNGVVSQGKEYPIDLLVFSTGFHLPGGLNPAKLANIKIRGRNGTDLEEKYTKRGVSTLHGVMSNGFPNLFFATLSQAAQSANYTSVLDQHAEQVSYMISEAFKKAEKGQKVILEPTEEAEEAWAGEILQRVMNLSALSGCTPGYYNGEGKMDEEKSPEEQMRAARGAIWGHGFADYVDKTAKWRAQGGMDGIEITVK